MTSQAPASRTHASNGARYSSRSTVSPDPRVVGPAPGLGVVADVVLDRGRDARGLQAADVADRQASGEHWVLGEELEPAPAQRRPHQVDGGGEQDVHALAPGLHAESGGEPADEFVVPRGAERGRAGHAGRRVALVPARAAHAGRPSDVTIGRRPIPGSPRVRQLSAPVSSPTFSATGRAATMSRSERRPATTAGASCCRMVISLPGPS